MGDAHHSFGFCLLNKRAFMAQSLKNIMVRLVVGKRNTSTGEAEAEG